MKKIVLFVVVIAALIGLPLTVVLIFSNSSNSKPSRTTPTIANTNPTAKTLSDRINPADGAAMALIPAGPFIIGDADSPKNKLRTVTLPAYYIYKTDVTIGRFKRFCKATGRSLPSSPGYHLDWTNEAFPVNVTFEEAASYCAWAGVHLPTDAEWEKAARGTDGRKYPWGNLWDPTKCANPTVNFLDHAVKVGQYTDSPYGLSDMAGNVWQWCDGDFDGTGKAAPLRGGCYDFPQPVGFQCSISVGGVKGHDGGGGFRCVYRLGTGGNESVLLQSSTTPTDNDASPGDKNPNQVDINGTPRLLYAVIHGNKEEAETLLSQGVDPNAEDRTGFSPLLAASQENRKDIIILLLVHKADINLETFGADTVLIWAIKAKNKDMVRFLVENGADVNKGGVLGETPLHYAHLILPSVEKYLIAHGAR